MPLISIVTACYNEEENVNEVYQRVKNVMSALSNYQYEHIFIDNASGDTTVEKLKEIAKCDSNVKIIVNARNFGHIRSPFYGLMQAKGDLVMSIVCDLQDPPELIPEFVKKWEEGFKIVVGVKETTSENKIMSFFRKFYYRLISKIASTKQIKHFTGFGLYDKKIIEALKTFDDPYPYFRGMISEVGFEIAEIPYHQPLREKGLTKNNFYTLYDMAMLGITSYSNIPIRLAILSGFICALASIAVAIVFFVLKLLFWNHFTVGVAPILIGIFFFAGVQLFFIGLLGEYISSIHTHVKRRPLVFVKETVNIDI
ncbi:MAG: glycosyltransferase family 2 protein [Gammaproteobacteria bacterium]|nr:glycosyltransferase family 2 protein [Gammaproteobacteria bacterium]